MSNKLAVIYNDNIGAGQGLVAQLLMAEYVSFGEACDSEPIYGFISELQ